MLNNIFLKFSEFAMLNKDEHSFSDKYSATTEAVLTDYLSTEDMVDASVDELVAFIRSKSRGRIAFWNRPLICSRRPHRTPTGWTSAYTSH